jgi:hypothetical protein
MPARVEMGQSVMTFQAGTFAGLVGLPCLINRLPRPAETEGSTLLLQQRHIRSRLPRQQAMR